MKLTYSSGFSWSLAAGSVWALVRLVQTPPSLAQLLILFVACFLLTDLISGILHVILDNPRSLDVPVISVLAAGFQRHHKNPSNIFEMPLYQHLYPMHMPLTGLFIIVLPFNEPLLYLAFLMMVAMLHLMQMAHRWSHMAPETVPMVVRGLQRARILLPNKVHARHHVEPFSQDFCIMTGMTNAPLNVAVRAFGGTSHLWNAVFLVVALTPLGVAWLLI